jgi:predicted DNA-binding transcriptional regulator YafY
MIDNETSRLSRLTAILTLLLSKKLLTATEISKKFGISVRTVYRDIRALEAAGVPIVTEEGKGYSLVDGYKLPPIMFTETEAYALITSEQIILRNKDSSLKKGFSDAIAKIKAVMQQSRQENVELLTERMYIGKNFDNEETSASLLSLQMALTHHQVVKIAYLTPDGTATTREIEPYAIYQGQEEDWTLVAYCRLRKDFRSFRLDRMQQVDVQKEVFPPHTITIKQYLERKSKHPKHP